MTDLRMAINDLESPIIDLDTAYSAFAYFAEAADDDHRMAMVLHFVANTMGQIRDDLRARYNVVHEASKEKSGPALVG